MEEVLMESHGPAPDKTGSLVLDIESLTQTSESSSASPKMLKKTLSRKGSSRTDRRNVEEQDADGATKKLLVKGISPVANISNLPEGGDGRMRKFNHFMTINPKKILLLFASMSSVGTIILIYFTLVIYFRGA